LAKLRILALHLLILATVAVAAGTASLTFGRVFHMRQVPHFPRLPVRIETNADADPIALANLGLRPGANYGRRRPSAAIHVIMVTPAGVSLRAGGRRVRWIATTPTVHNLVQLAAVIADRSWVSQPAPGVINLRAALIMERGTTLTIAPPLVHRLRMIAGVPGVFLGAAHARLMIRSVTITSSRPVFQGSYRPFVLADSSSRMQITRARLSGLGWNWNDSYGVAWKNHATGGATGSVFSGNYFGLYTGRVAGVRFVRNVVSGNFFYGVDPHTYSTNLTIAMNTVTGNGRHGIIFSDHVSASTVEGNVVRGNAANGIMMDQASTGNVITGNTVTSNHGDGIVLTRSPANRVVTNVVRGNRIGLRLTGTRPRGVTVRGNVVAGNAVNAQGVLSTAGNTVASDTLARWNPDGLAVIWVLGAVLVTVTLMSLTSCLLSDRQAR
jgi:poly(beta-D-mannuronate) C5 epimerase